MERNSLDDAHPAEGGREADAASAPSLAATPTSPYAPEKVTEWMLQECIETGRKIDSYVRLDATLLSIALSLFSAAVGLALSHGYAELLLGLPLAFSLYFCLMQYFHGEFLGLAGYKAALERRINREARVPIVFWESALARSHHRSRTPVLTWIVMGAIYIAGSVAAIVESFKFTDQGGWSQRHSALLIGLTIASVLAGLLLCLFADQFARSEFGRVERDAEEVLAKSDAAQPGAARLDGQAKTLVSHKSP